MKKADRTKITNEFRNMSKENLTRILSTFNYWESNHGLKKNSWFWRHNGNQRERNYNEKKFTFDDELSIGNTTFYYSSDCSMSRNHVYWSDSLWCSEPGVKVNFGDISKLSSEISLLLKDTPTA